MGGVFISYRRDDTAPYAGRLRDRLTAVFGKDQIFRDVDRVAPGERFPVVIEGAVGSCDAFIALIGNKWLTAEGDNRGRRLDDPRDYVRQEVAAALRREEVLVIPVLVEGAEMPGPDDLPEELAPLAERNALVMSDIRWDDDMNHLVDALQRVVRPPGKKRAAAKPRERERARPVAPPPPTPPPAPEPGGDRGQRPERSRFPVATAAIVGVVCLALVAVIAVVLAGGGGGDGGEEAGGGGDTTVATTVPGPVSLAVPGGQAWTDTAVDVQVNQTVVISASGRIRHHDEPPLTAGPEGNPDPGLRQFNLPNLEGYNHASLIAKIGEAGKPFFVGAELTLTAPTAGRLFLGINDVGVYNNGEGFTAEIRTG
jgi:TIR domain-containing protein